MGKPGDKRSPEAQALLDKIAGKKETETDSGSPTPSPAAAFVPGASPVNPSLGELEQVIFADQPPSTGMGFSGLGKIPALQERCAALELENQSLRARVSELEALVNLKAKPQRAGTIARPNSSPGDACAHTKTKTLAWGTVCEECGKKIR